MGRTTRFGELEALVMNRLWNDGAQHGVTMRDILRYIDFDEQVSYPAVRATMENLCTTGWLRRIQTAGEPRYQPILTREQHTARLLAAAVTDGPCSRPASIS